MNERVARLRQETLETQPWLSIERAALLTCFYRNGRDVSVPVARARAFQSVLENKAIYLGDDELIVGERGPSPKAAPTFPELCCHSLEDLEILDTRERVSYSVPDEARRIQKEQIIPYWRGRSMRDLIFQEMTPEWKDAYSAGIYTEFMEQRAPGHTVLGDVIYRRGLLDLQAEIAARLAELDFFRDPEAYQKQEELRAMAIASQVLHSYIYFLLN